MWIVQEIKVSDKEQWTFQTLEGPLGTLELIGMDCPGCQIE